MWRVLLAWQLLVHGGAAAKGLAGIRETTQELIELVDLELHSWSTGMSVRHRICDRFDDRRLCFISTPFIREEAAVVFQSQSHPSHSAECLRRRMPRPGCQMILRRALVL